MAGGRFSTWVAGALAADPRFLMHCPLQISALVPLIARKSSTFLAPAVRLLHRILSTEDEPIPVTCSVAEAAAFKLMGGAVLPVWDVEQVEHTPS